MSLPFFVFRQKLLIIASFATLSLVASVVANAQSAITMDGSTGTGSGAMQDFNIPGAHVIPINGDGPNANGTQSGSNLFFSFSQFGISAGDTALFQCPGGCSGVTNVISTVTGGVDYPSVFDGTLVSIIGNANFWFFNSAGVTVNGAINIPLGATYHISNADSLSFSNNLSWSTSPSNTSSSLSSLTSAAPTSFYSYLLESSPSIIIEVTNLNPESTISTAVVKTVTESLKPVIDIAQMNNGSLLPLPKNPCTNPSKSSLISKGVANYIPDLSSQVSTSVLTTAGGVSSAATEQALALAQAKTDDCQ